jgi:metal-responsive CopG/Arc/MetJ family transcriptional regulator
MGKSARVNVKTPKKRAPVTGDLVGVRLQPEMAKEIDNWRRKQADLPNRPEAIRRLVEIALRMKKRAQ